MDGRARSNNFLLYIHFFIFFILNYYCIDINLTKYVNDI